VPNPTDITVVIDKLLSPKVRTIIYVIAFIAVPVLGVVGWLSDEQVQRILWIVGLVLGFGSAGLSTANAPKKAVAAGPVVTTDGTRVGRQ
jgi:hypothetical protein